MNPRSRADRVILRHRGLALLVVLAALAAPAIASADGASFVLVRHAEKMTGGNPRLTDAGEARSQALLQVVEDAEVVAVYATEWCRTALTTGPVAERFGLEIRIQDNGRDGDQLADCGDLGSVVRIDPAIATVDDLAAHLLSTHTDGVVVVVGHSNTTPELVEALGAPSVCPSLFELDDRGCHIPDDPPESEYHHLFVVTVEGPDAPRLFKAQYGQAP